MFRGLFIAAGFGVIAVTCTDSAVAPRQVASTLRVASSQYCELIDVLPGYWNVTEEGLPDGAELDVRYQNGDTWVYLCYQDEEETGGDPPPEYFCSSEVYLPECDDGGSGGGGDGGGGDGGGGVGPTLCHDERDIMVFEYQVYAAMGGTQWIPFCGSFTNTGGSANFSWEELNGHFQQGNPHEPWGMFVRAQSLEETRTNYGAAIWIESGYRCPHGMPRFQVLL